MMSWVAILLWVIIHIPTFIGILKEILDLIHSVPSDQKVSFQQAISDAIHTGDKKAVKEALKHVHTVCTGIGCQTPTLAP